MSKSFNNKIKSYFTRCQMASLKNKIVVDNNIYISDSYSIVKLFNNDFINKNKNDIIEFFTSEKEKNTICIVGCDGIAYLLGCVIL